MDILQNFIDRYPQSIGQVFSDYNERSGNKLPFLRGHVNKKKFAAAIYWLRKTPFLHDLAEAATLEQQQQQQTPVVVVPAAGDSMDGYYYEYDEGYDYASGRREKRKAKKAAKKAQRSARSASSTSVDPSSIVSGINYQPDPQASDDGSTAPVSSGMSRADKIATAFGVFGGIANTASQLASSISAAKNGTQDTTEVTPYQSQFLTDPSQVDSADTTTGIGQYKMYIIGGVILLAVAIGAYLLLKKRG